MRTDLSANFINAKNASFRAPRLIAVFHFNQAGDVYLASGGLGTAADAFLPDDRFLSDDVFLPDVSIETGSAPYEMVINGTLVTVNPIIENWGELVDAGDAESFVNSEVRQMTLTLWNGGAAPFSNLFLLEDPENVEVEIFQTFLGLDDEDKAIWDRFVVRDPVEFDEASRLLTLDLVSISMRYDGQVGPVLATDDWPHAKPGDVGKGLPLVLGSPGRVKTLCSRTGAVANLATSVVASTVNIHVEEDLDEEGFPASGVFVIDEETIYYPSRDSDTFINCSRGHDNTVAAAHSEGATVTQSITDHTYLIGQGPVASITKVKISGHPAPAAWFTAYPALNPARIIFNRKPSFTSYSNTKTGEVWFDKESKHPDIPGGVDTALFSHYAFQKKHKSDAAILAQPDHDILALLQTDTIGDAGAIEKVYLYATHWATRVYDNEIVTVWVEGIGNIGTLTRPNADDDYTLEADLDVDHDHDHEVGNAHTHSHNDGGYGSSQTRHDHGSPDVKKQQDWASATAHRIFSPSGVAQSYGRWGYYDPVLYHSGDPYGNGMALADSIVTRVKITVVGSGYKCTVELTYRYNNTTYSPTIHSNNGSGARSFTYTKVLSHHVDPRDVKVRAWGTHTDSDLTIHSVLFAEDGRQPVESSRPAVSTALSSSGSNVSVSSDVVKSLEDVKRLEEENRPLNITKSATSTRDITDYFDITDFDDVTWDWFKGREVRFILSGDTPAGKDPVWVMVTYTAIEVEYKERQVSVSDEVTCEVAGALNSNPARLAQYLLTEKAGLPGARYDSLAWGEAIDWYDSQGYRFDALLSAGLTVREALKKIVRQARGRIIWTGGKTKYLIRRQQLNWQPVRHLTPSELQLKSISARRQALSEITNAINLAYRRDWSIDDEETSYQQLVSVANQDSITQHGRIESRDDWRFDLVGDGAMAADLASFFIEQLSTPSTFYELSAYLPQFDLEKEDVLQLSSEFGRLRKAAGIIRAADFLPGSGKNKKINLIRLLVEVLRYHLIEVAIEDRVLVSDALNVELGLNIYIDDLVHVGDDLSVGIGKNHHDTVHVSDALAILMEWRTELADIVTVSDSLSVHFNVKLNDTVQVHDTLQVWHDLFGYGRGPYGQVPYGGSVLSDNLMVDHVAVTDQLAIELRYSDGSIKETEVV